jgi:hypothetical protein
MAGTSADFGARFSPESCQTNASVAPGDHLKHPKQLKIQNTPGGSSKTGYID